MSNSKNDAAASAGSASKQKSVLEILLSDETLSDVTLRGSDGVAVAANRCILAARSTVFQRMLFGEYSEASDTVVEVGFDGWILDAVVRFIYLDKAVSLINEDFPSEDVARTIFSLINAASYFDLPEMSEYLIESTEEVMANVAIAPSLALSLLEQCEEEGADPDASKRLTTLALEEISSDPRQHLVDSGLITTLGVSTLETLLSASNMNWTSELEKFLLLRQWEQEAADIANDEKLSVAARMTEYLSLELIRAKDLVAIVSASQFVKRDKIFDAFKSQALKEDLYASAKLKHKEAFAINRALISELSQASIRPRFDSEIRPHMRRVLVDWMLEVQWKRKDLSAVLFTAINILDKYLRGGTTNRSELQLVGVTALIVASKTRSNSNPMTPHEAVSVTDDAYTERQVSPSYVCNLHKNYNAASLLLCCVRYAKWNLSF